MNQWLLDTDVAILLINTAGKQFGFLLGADVAISSITAYELRVGVEKCRSEATRQETLGFLSAVAILDFDTAAAVESARVRGELEKMGQGIGPYDTLIAGHCRANGRTLLTNNTREFKRVKNLNVRSV